MASMLAGTVPTAGPTAPVLVLRVVDEVVAGPAAFTGGAPSRALLSPPRHAATVKSAAAPTKFNGRIMASGRGVAMNDLSFGV
jgi:hypothetical protein